MTAADQKGAGAGPTPMTLLKQEIRRYFGAQVKHLAHKAGTRLTGAAGLGSVDEDSGTLPKIGSRVLRGESPLKAAGAEKAQDVEKKVTGKVKDKMPGGGSDEGGRSDDLKATTIVETIDVGAPLRFAYDHWTEYERFSGFTKGVQEAERGEAATSEWTVKIGPSTRKWKATVQEQIPDDRVVWTSEGAQGTTQGAVSFHEITPTRTRIVLVVVYQPSGAVERTGNIWRAQGRRVRLDFKNFKRYVASSEEEPEGWRGEIREGEVVRTHEEAVAEEEDESDANDEEYEEGE